MTEVHLASVVGEAEGSARGKAGALVLARPGGIKWTKKTIIIRNAPWTVWHPHIRQAAIVSQTLPEDKFIVIYAVEFPTPNPLTGAVKFYRNVDPLFVASVSKMLGYETPVMYINPVVWSQNQVLRIDAYANATGTEYMVLKGYVAELCGKTVTCK